MTLYNLPIATGIFLAQRELIPGTSNNSTEAWQEHHAVRRSVNSALEEEEEEEEEAAAAEEESEAGTSWCQGFGKLRRGFGIGKKPGKRRRC